MKKLLWRPCSEHDVRAAVLKAAHERVREMDERGEKTVGKFGDILREASAQFRAYGENEVKLGRYKTLSWVDFKKAVAAFHRRRVKATA